MPLLVNHHRLRAGIECQVKIHAITAQKSYGKYNRYCVFVFSKKFVNDFLAIVAPSDAMCASCALNVAAACGKCQICALQKSMGNKGGQASHVQFPKQGNNNISICFWVLGLNEPRKNSGSHIDASHSRQPFVKGEKLARYEVNAVMHNPLSSGRIRCT